MRKKHNISIGQGRFCCCFMPFLGIYDFRLNDSIFNWSGMGLIGREFKLVNVPMHIISKHLYIILSLFHLSLHTYTTCMWHRANRHCLYDIRTYYIMKAKLIYIWYHFFRPSIFFRWFFCVPSSLLLCVPLKWHFTGQCHIRFDYTCPCNTTAIVGHIKKNTDSWAIKMITKTIIGHFFGQISIQLVLGGIAYNFQCPFHLQFIHLNRIAIRRIKKLLNLLSLPFFHNFPVITLTSWAFIILFEVFRRLICHAKKKTHWKQSIKGYCLNHSNFYDMHKIYSSTVHGQWNWLERVESITF